MTRTWVPVIVITAVLFSSCAQPATIFDGLAEQPEYMEKYERLDSNSDPVKNEDGTVEECYTIPNGRVKEFYDVINTTFTERAIQPRQVSTLDSNEVAVAFDEGNIRKTLYFNQVSFDKTLSCLGRQTIKIFDDLITMPVGAEQTNIYGTNNDGSPTLPKGTLKSESYSVPEESLKATEDQLLAALLAQPGGLRDIGGSAAQPQNGEWRVNLGRTEGHPLMAISASKFADGKTYLTLDTYEP